MMRTDTQRVSAPAAVCLWVGSVCTACAPFVWNDTMSAVSVSVAGASAMMVGLLMGASR